MDKVNKQQLILLALGLVLIVFLAYMPKAVINNKGGGVEEEVSASTETMNPESHANLSEEDKNRIETARVTFNTSQEEDKITHLNNLVQVYKSLNMYDSAAIYYENYAQEQQDMDSWYQSGVLYYDAYTFAIQQERIALFETKTRSILGDYIEKNPTGEKSENAEVMIGMTYIRSENPMQGIMKVRSVLQKNPKNEMALNNMGLLAIQSGQFDKGVTRFEKLVELYPENAEYRYYYGVCLHELGQEEASHNQFEWVEKNAKDPLLREAAAKNKH